MNEVAIEGENLFHKGRNFTLFRIIHLVRSKNFPKN